MRPIPDKPFMSTDDKDVNKYCRWVCYVILAGFFLHAGAGVKTIHQAGGILAAGLFLCACFWFPIKAAIVTLGTITNWKYTNPGEPMYKSGGLTEYDSDFAREVGRAAAEATIRSSSHSSHKCTYGDRHNH